VAFAVLALWGFACRALLCPSSPLRNGSVTGDLSALHINTMLVGGPCEPRCIGHLCIPVLDTKQFDEIFHANSLVEQRNCQHVLDIHCFLSAVLFAERRYTIRYPLFPIGILFVLLDVVHISEYLLGDVAWKKTEKQNKSVQSQYATDALTKQEYPRK
jgi:hypothetical protein